MSGSRATARGARANGGAPTKGKAPARKKVAAKKPPAKKAATPRKKRSSVGQPAPAQTATSSAGKRSLRRRALWWGLKMAVATAMLFILLTSAWIVTYRYVNPPLTPLMILRNVQDEEDVRKRWRDYNEISGEFLLSVVAAEDQLFFKHNGFDTKQIRAAIETWRDGGKLRGGSTISQQVAKNVFLWPGRSWVRKGLEVWFTAGIELCWSKQRILETYVNIAEMGQGIYGVEAAARHYYHKSASDLTREESALLAAVLPAPRKRSPAQPSDYLRTRQAWIMKQMWNLGGVSYLRQE